MYVLGKTSGVVTKTTIPEGYVAAQQTTVTGWIPEHIHGLSNKFAFKLEGGQRVVRTMEACFPGTGVKEGESILAPFEERPAVLPTPDIGQVRRVPDVAGNVLKLKDCGDTVGVPCQVGAHDMPTLVGRYRILEDGTPALINIDDVHLIGKEIQIRSITKCRSPNPMNSCKVCSGNPLLVVHTMEACFQGTGVKEGESILAPFEERAAIIPTPDIEKVRRVVDEQKGCVGRRTQAEEDNPTIDSIINAARARVAAGAKNQPLENKMITPDYTNEDGKGWTFILDGDELYVSHGDDFNPSDTASCYMVQRLTSVHASPNYPGGNRCQLGRHTVFVSTEGTLRHIDAETGVVSTTLLPGICLEDLEQERIELQLSLPEGGTHLVPDVTDIVLGLIECGDTLGVICMNCIRFNEAVVSFSSIRQGSAVTYVETHPVDEQCENLGVTVTCTDGNHMTFMVGTHAHTLPLHDLS